MTLVTASKWSSLGFLVGRLLLTAFFFASAATQLANPSSTQKHLANHGVPAVGLFYVLGLALQLGGGLLVLAGYKTRSGILALVIFLIATTLLFHTPLGVRLQAVSFVKNLSILGGLLVLLAAGPGPFSVDHKGEKP